MAMLNIQPALAAGLDIGSATPEEVAPELRKCLLDMDVGRRWASCLGIYSNPCEAKSGDFHRCYAIEGQAWHLLVAEEFAMTFAYMVADDKIDEGTYFERRARALCSAQAAWGRFAEKECELQSSRAGRGSIRKVYGTLCWQKMNSARAISLRSDRSRPTGTTDFEKLRPIADLNEDKFRLEIGKWCDVEKGVMQ
jgi:lysozyme inhibitor LprI